MDCNDIILFMLNNNSKFFNIIVECRDLLQQLGNPSIRHNYHEANKVTNTLTKAGVNMHIPISTMIVPPVFVRDKLEVDKFKMLFVKTKI